MLSNIGCAAIKRIGGSQISTNRVLATVWQWQRVEGQQNAGFTLGSPSASFLALRLYATATKAKATTAKKATTKKAPATKATSKKSAAKKPAKNAVKKSATKPVKKPVKKAVKKPVKKAKAKVTAKPKKKRAKKVVLTAAQKLRKQLKELKVTALLAETPKLKPDNAFKVLLVENCAGASIVHVGDNSKAVSEKFKLLSTAELERLNHIAIENKAANALAYKRWIESYTADEIRLANLARHRIRRLNKRSHSPKLLKDDRAVKRMVGSLAFFTKARYDSGDFAGKSSVDSMRSIVAEFKQLSIEGRKPYTDAASVDRERYFQEYKKVYKHEPRTIRDAQAKAEALAKAQARVQAVNEALAKAQAQAQA